MNEAVLRAFVEKLAEDRAVPKPFWFRKQSPEESDRMAQEGSKNWFMAGAGAVGAMGANLGLGELSDLADGPHDDDVFKRLSVKSHGSGVPVTEGGGVTLYARPQDISDRYKAEYPKGVINVSNRSASSLAHEMGHASGTWGKKLLSDPAMLSKWLAVEGGAALAGGVPATLSAFGLAAAKNEEEVDRALKPAAVGAVVGSGMHLPMLLEEARANMRVPGLLREAGASYGTVAKSMARLLPAYGTYLASAAVPVAPWAVLKYLGSRKKKALEKEKSAEREPMTKGQLGRFLKNTAVIGVGAGLGAGTGWAAKKGLEHWLRGSPHLPRIRPFVIPAMAGGMGLAAWLASRRDDVRDKTIEDAGIRDRAEAEEKKKTAMDPVTLTTLLGGAGGAAVGGGAGGLANALFGMGPKGVARAAVGGSLIGLWKGRRAGKVMTGQEAP